nr:hypothetical protein [Tanacetum cinerariifolium]
MRFSRKKGESGFGGYSTAEDVTQGIDGSCLTAIVTTSSGIGAETARVLALHGVHVVMAVRNTETGTKVKERLLKETPNSKIDVMELDLSSLAFVRKHAIEHYSSGLPLNILIYGPIEAYGRSKLANILHANELARQFMVIYKKMNLSSHCIVPIILFPYPRCRIGNGLTKEIVIEVDQPEDDKPEEESKVAEETIVDDKPEEESKVVDETIATDETKESKVIEQIAEDI